MKLHACLRTYLIGACAGLIFATLSAQAADPAPAASAATQAATQAPVKLAQAGNHNAAPMWRDVRHGDTGITTIKGAETGVLIQSEGNAWRKFRNGPVTLVGGLLLVVISVAILLFHAWKGQIRMSAQPTGRKLVRFTLVERWLHNIVGGCFVLLAIGGLMEIFGKHVLVPFLGHTLFSLVLQVLKPVHNFLGLVFIVALLAMIVMWAKDNVWNAIDAQWIRRAGGLLDRSHVPSGRFNFGEKTWFWFGVTILGLTVSGSGLLLDFPTFLELRSSLQLANLVHGISALVMILLALGHIYMGTIGVEGALDSMRNGEVDEIWAKDHHEAWYQQAIKDRRG
ncbi:MAG: formate dehydrogenase subunit gamma [Sulfuritalea sp.]|nr:formate dehydrogenase subunit gamma [Sulfuritalea sp.]